MEKVWNRNNRKRGQMIVWPKLCRAGYFKIRLSDLKSVRWPQGWTGTKYQPWHFCPRPAHYTISWHYRSCALGSLWFRWLIDWFFYPLLLSATGERFRRLLVCYTWLASFADSAITSPAHLETGWLKAHDWGVDGQRRLSCQPERNQSAQYASWSVHSWEDTWHGAHMQLTLPVAAIGSCEL